MQPFKHFMKGVTHLYIRSFLPVWSDVDSVNMDVLKNSVIVVYWTGDMRHQNIYFSKEARLLHTLESIE